jgi:hypothetical protein
MNRNVCCGLVLTASLMGLTNCSSGSGGHDVINHNVPPTVTATSGTPQSHTISSAFGSPLVATVATNGTPMSGVVVTFSAPATGASGTFKGGVKTATTDSNGVATSPVFTANGTVGSYTVIAAVDGATAPASFSLDNTTGPPAAIAAKSGTPQNVVVNKPFVAPLVVTVADSGQNPVSGATVVFTAPATGASGVFADTTTNTTTATTDANGAATSAVFTANGISGADTVMASVAGVATAAAFSLVNMAGAPATITASGGATQSTPINTAFSMPLVATVLDSGSNPASGVAVTFTAPASGASGTFANGTATETDTTDADGMATSTTFSANSTTGGPYEVTATATGVSAPADFSLTNRVPSNTYVFYLGGQEAFGTFYALAGSIEVDTSGNVLAGEQDYNDGEGFTSPQPGGDTILGGTLLANPTNGRAKLTLNTNNTNLGVGGVETLVLQFSNSNHAQIIQFDGTATSSGSFDLQKLPTTLSGGFAFALTGIDYGYAGPIAFGGVFNITGGTTLENGTVDTNDYGAVTTGVALSGTLTTFDSFGRGALTSTLNYYDTPIAFNYYVVGPEVIRIIDVDPIDTAVGSAFGQGANATAATNASLGTSVFNIAGNPYPVVNYGVAGMFTTSNTSASSASFSGVGDDNEVTLGLQFSGSPISGNYSIASNGYGNFTIAPGDLGDVSLLGVYLTDPNLNLNDPNNTAAGVGGALVADMDPALPGGIGVVTPQTDTATASFTGKYAFGGQGSNFFCCEFDFVGAGGVTPGGVFRGLGYLSDPFFTFGAKATNAGVTFFGIPLADTSNPGRYTMSSLNPTPNPLRMTVAPTIVLFDMAIYQANGGQLFWLNVDPGSVFLGSLQQQGSLSGLPGTTSGEEPSTKTKKR